MNESAERHELGAFLKACRAHLRPSDVGLPDTGGHRKVEGLRREEAAAIAAISVDYYTRLEQGRVQASGAVLGVLARAFRMTEDQRTYLYEIARKTVEAPRRRRLSQTVRPAMRRLLDQLTGTPALVLGRRLDILHWNQAAAALFTDFAAVPAQQRNYLRLLFLDPQVRALHLEWEHDARDAVAALRMEGATDPDDVELSTLVGDLSLHDANFRTWWAERHVNSASYGTKHYMHPTVGELTLDCDTWQSPDGSGQRLMVLTAERGSPSNDGLQILASWDATGAAERRLREPRSTR